MHQIAPSCTKLDQVEPKCTKLHQAAPNYTKLHLSVPNGTKLHQTAPSFTNLHQVAPVCTLSSNLDFAFTDLSQYESCGHWLWYDLLDILDLLAPYEQDCIDYPQQERECIERAILHPNEFFKTCWYWLDLLIIGIDEVDRF